MTMPEESTLIVKDFDPHWRIRFFHILQEVRPVCKTRNHFTLKRYSFPRQGRESKALGAMRSGFFIFCTEGEKHRG